MEGQSAPLTAAQRGRIRRLSQPRELSPDEEGGELNIVPFLDIIMNVLIFVLATIAVTFTATIDTTPPASQSGGVRSSVESTALNLTIFIVNEGFSLKASGGNIAPGCEGAGPGITIPKKGNQYDFELLNTCAARLKKASPEFDDETQVFITANPGTEYQTIVQVLDAVRTTPQGESLFTDANFKVPR
ncbi:MAG: biopolymer transporter ExbD [Polyangiaceae bacterium]|nr:biopolymer transporter ExbD [Polyangiaceae bacterium]MCK6535231.1 biopolymer transporter ExbD [Polyangiaceae bacterium]